MAKKKKKKKKKTKPEAPKPPTLAEKIAELLHVLYDTQNELAGSLDRLQAELPGLDNNGMGDLVLVLDDLKEDQESGLKQTNKAVTAVHESFCTSLIDDNMYAYDDHKHAKFTASVKGHFTVKDGNKFYEWLCDNLDDACDRMAEINTETDKPFLAEEHLDDIETSIDLYLACTKRKREMRAVCESLLQNGESLPDGVSAFVQQKVTIYRKGRKGKTVGEF